MPISIGTATLLLTKHNLFIWFLSSVIFGSILYISNIFKKLTRGEKRSVIAMSIPFLGSIVFFTMLLQIYASVTLYVERGVNRHFFEWVIPTAWFSSFEAICVSLLLPLVTYLWKILGQKQKLIHDESKIVFGLFVTSLGFLLLAVSVTIKIHPVICIFIVFTANACLAIGELSVIPVSMSLTNLLAPKKLKGMAMGFYYFSLMSSGYLAGQIAKFAPSSENLLNHMGFSSFFLILAIILVLFGCILGLLYRYLRLK